MSEAHAKDEWALYSDVCFDQPKTLQERLTIAKKFATRLHGNVPLVIDSIENPLENIFSSWPERLYIVQRIKDDGDGSSKIRVQFKGDLGPDGYLPEKVEEWLEQYVDRKK